MLTGPGCSGKSTVCTLLAAAYRQLRMEGGGMGYPRVKTTTIHPAQHTVEEVRMHVHIYMRTCILMLVFMEVLMSALISMYVCLYVCCTSTRLLHELY